MQENIIQLTLESAIPQTPVYTIGYGRRSIEQFIELLHRYEITYVIDIRSKPYSRMNQQFSQDTFEKIIKQNQLRYLFMGDTLGGRPADVTCYVDGKVNYSKVREKDFYKQGINRIHSANEKQIRVALMCAEAKPQECHRSKLIGNTLHSQKIQVAHIDEQGNLKTQQEINELLVGKQQLSLFDNDPSQIMENEKVNFSRKKYSPPDKR